MDLIFFLYVRGGRLVGKSTRAGGDTMLSGCRIFLLSKCAEAIDMCVGAEKEDGLTGLEKVSAISIPTPVFIYIYIYILNKV